MSPELVNGVSYSKEVDIWAFGCFAFELATGTPPFQHELVDLTTLFRQITTEPVPQIPAKWSAEFRDFVDKCLIKDPKKRWTIDQLLAHDFLVSAEASRRCWERDYANWVSAEPTNLFE